MENPFIGENHGDDNLSVFTPNPAITNMWKSFDRDWSILDVGCGDGQNTLFLAEKGFKNLDAFDISEAVISKLQRTADQNHLTINAWAEDLTLFTFTKQYDLIMSFGTLHFVTKANWLRFIQKAKLATRENGIHMIQILTDKLPPSEDIAPFVQGLAQEGELQNQYTDWHMMEAVSHIFEDYRRGADSHFYTSDRIVARKPAMGLYAHDPCCDAFHVFPTV